MTTRAGVSPAVRDDPPVTADWGLVVRTIGPVGPVTVVGPIAGGAEPKPSTGTTTTVAANVANVTLQAANANRIGLMIFNNTTGAVLVRLGTPAAAGTFTVRIVPLAYYELPFPCYTGIVTGIWEAASAGNALMTELT